MKLFKVSLLSVVLLMGTSFISMPAFAQNPHCTAPNGCTVGAVGAGIGIAVNGTNVAEPIVSIAPNPNFTGLGTLTIDNLLDHGLAVSSTVCTDSSSNLTTYGCGGLSVTSINANLTAAPTTGNIILNFSNSPTFMAPNGIGTVTAHTFASTAAGSSPSIMTWIDGLSNGAYMTSNGLLNVAGVYNQAFGIYDNSNPELALALDKNGNLGINGVFSVGGITQGQCLTTDISGRLIGSGAACPVAYQNGTRMGGMHFEGENDAAIGASTTATFTFNQPFGFVESPSLPVCMASNSNVTSTPSVTVDGPPTRYAVTLYNSSSSPATFNVSCIGY